MSIPAVSKCSAASFHCNCRLSAGLSRGTIWGDVLTTSPASCHWWQLTPLGECLWCKHCPSGHSSITRMTGGHCKLESRRSQWPDIWCIFSHDQISSGSLTYSSTRFRKMKENCFCIAAEYPWYSEEHERITSHGWWSTLPVNSW